MKERRNNTNKGITKTVILKTIRYTIIFDILSMIVIGIFLFLIGAISNPIFWKMIFSILLFYNLLIIYFFGSIYIRKENSKTKARIAKEIFIKDDSTIIYPKVFPKKGHFKQRKFFENELPQMADYYANMYENGVIEVVAKLKDKKMSLHIENITKEGFIDAYDVLETTLTDSSN